MKALRIAFLALLVSTPALAIDGDRLRVIDGDTVALGPEPIRLLDVDAPETVRPRCGAEHLIGIAARIRLIAFLDGKEVEIHRSGIDRYGRTLARLSADGQDVGAWLLREGLAVRWEPGRRAYAARAAHWCGRR